MRPLILLSLVVLSAGRTIERLEALQADEGPGLVLDATTTTTTQAPFIRVVTRQGPTDGVGATAPTTLPPGAVTGNPHISDPDTPLGLGVLIRTLQQLSSGIAGSRTRDLGDILSQLSGMVITSSRLVGLEAEPDLKFASDADVEPRIAFSPGDITSESAALVGQIGQIGPQLEEWRAQVAAARARIENEIAAQRQSESSPVAESEKEEKLGPDYVQPLLVATREVLTQLLVAQNQIQTINLSLRRMVSTMTRLITPEGLDDEQSGTTLDFGGVIISAIDAYRNQLAQLTQRLQEMNRHASEIVAASGRIATGRLEGENGTFGFTLPARRAIEGYLELLGGLQNQLQIINKNFQGILVAGSRLVPIGRRRRQTNLPTSLASMMEQLRGQLVAVTNQLRGMVTASRGNVDGVNRREQSGTNTKPTRRTTTRADFEDFDDNEDYDTPATPPPPRPTTARPQPTTAAPPTAPPRRRSTWSPTVTTKSPSVDDYDEDEDAAFEEDSRNQGGLPDNADTGPPKPPGSDGGDNGEGPGNTFDQLAGTGQGVVDQLGENGAPLSGISGQTSQVERVLRPLQQSINEFLTAMNRIVAGDLQPLG